MSNVWFSSDWHLGHVLASRIRGFDSVAEHDEAILSAVSSSVGKRDKLFVLGDVAFRREAIAQVRKLPGVKELIIGNHDQQQIQDYLAVFTKVHGFRKYNNFWLSHCPIHPQEMYRCIGNIHGHIHKGAATPPLPLPYFNVNVDFHEMRPVNFDEIHETFEGKQ